MVQNTWSVEKNIVNINKEASKALLDLRKKDKEIKNVSIYWNIAFPTGLFTKPFEECLLEVQLLDLQQLLLGWVYIFNFHDIVDVARISFHYI